MYTHTTSEQLKEKIKSLVGGDGVFWTDFEIHLAISEALLTFGAISNFWQEEIFVHTQLKKRIYDIFTDAELDVSIAPSLKVQIIIDWLNAELIENISD